jgi:hypothetical protein
VGKKKSLSFDERNCTAMMAWQVLKKTHGKTSRWQRPLKAYGKENIDGKAVSRRTTKPPNTAKHKRHRRARLCLVFLTNAHQSKPLPSVNAGQRCKNGFLLSLKGVAWYSYEQTNTNPMARLHVFSTLRPRIESQTS